MKLRYYINEKGEKIYTLKEKSPDDEPTKEAHYKYKEAPTFTRTKINNPLPRT
ncbi:MAG: hypothetical protein Q8P57_00360 [Candidatus Pacearchaeota archaeon]|nr:hypothetical protein [Candidatus Pacearchaeota archaeon]